jgi:hypothetical protein
MTNMHFVAYASIYAFSLFIGLLVCVKIGYFLGRRFRASKVEEDKDVGEGALDAAVFGLLGLLLAFSFSGALSTYGAHRDLLAEEASAVRGAYTRIDLLPEVSQSPLRILVRQYVQARIDTYQAVIYSPAADAAAARSRQLEEQIWKEAFDAAIASGNPAIISQVVDSFDKMFDAPERQQIAQYKHPPLVIYVLMFAVAMMAALLAGYGMAAHSTLPIMHSVIFAAAVSITIYVIVDLEYPRFGFFNPDPTNRVLVETLHGMR